MFNLRWPPLRGLDGKQGQHCRRDLKNRHYFYPALYSFFIAAHGIVVKLLVVPDPLQHFRRAVPIGFVVKEFAPEKRNLFAHE